MTKIPLGKSGYFAPGTLQMQFERVWAMPNKHTFTISPIRKLLERELTATDYWCDPFSGTSTLVGMSNDIDENTPANYHEDAIEFLKNRCTLSMEGILLDPPYSVEQAGRPYKVRGYGGTIGFALYMAQVKDEAARIVRVGGKAISFGWDSNGLGKKRGFEIVGGMLVAHGSSRRDTIVTVEVKRG